MQSAVSIWSPVVVGQLRNPRQYKGEAHLPLHKLHRSVEDLKIKVRNLAVAVMGMAVEARMDIEILCLVADGQGELQLIKHVETIRERIPLLEFNEAFMPEGDNHFFLQIKNLAWEGDMPGGQEVRIAYFIDYTVMATREQVVVLRSAEAGEVKGESLHEALRKLEEEVARVQLENQELHRQIFYHVRNISSLKKGLQKAENRNALLNRELDQYRQLTEKLQQKLARDTKSSARHPEAFPAPRQLHPQAEEADASLGSRIKKLYLNSRRSAGSEH